MTVQLDWPPDGVERLTEEAQRKGLSPDAYLLKAVLQQKGANGTRNDAEKRCKREEAGRSIRELRKGNILGPASLSAT